MKSKHMAGFWTVTILISITTNAIAQTWREPNILDKTPKDWLLAILFVVIPLILIIALFYFLKKSNE
jgi:hypothetical protein